MTFLRKLTAWLRGPMPPVVTVDDVIQWRRINPGRCMYCSYTRWANEEQGQNLKLEPHDCIEGNGPPAPLPVARIAR